MKIRNKSGFTLVEIMIVVAIIGLLAAIAIPNFVEARQNARAGVCINNLRQIDSAKEQLALETDLDDGDAIADTADLDPYIKGGFDGLACPEGGDYTVAAVGADPTCDGDASHTL